MNAATHSIQIFRSFSFISLHVFETIDWSANYPLQPEVLEYLKHVTRKHQINEHIKFQHEVKTVSWNAELMKWIVQYVDVSVPIAEEETRTFDIM